MWLHSRQYYLSIGAKFAFELCNLFCHIFPSYAISFSFSSARSSGNDVICFLYFCSMQHKNSEVNFDLWKEAEAYGDIQLMPFVDYYSLISLKTIALCILGVCDTNIPLYTCFGFKFLNFLLISLLHDYLPWMLLNFKIACFKYWFIPASITR